MIGRYLARGGSRVFYGGLEGKLQKCGERGEKVVLVVAGARQIKIT